MNAGEIAAMLAAIFAGLTFFGWVVDRFLTWKKRPLAALDGRVIGNRRSVEGRTTHFREIFEITNTGDADANVLDGVFFFGTQVFVEEGFLPPVVLRRGESSRLLVLGLDVDTAYVVIAYRHPGSRTMHVQWDPLYAQSKLQGVLDDQLEERRNLSWRKRRKYGRGRVIGPDGAARVSLRGKPREIILALQTAVGPARGIPPLTSQRE